MSASTPVRVSPAVVVRPESAKEEISVFAKDCACRTWPLTHSLPEVAANIARCENEIRLTKNLLERVNENHPDRKASFVTYSCVSCHETCTEVVYMLVKCRRDPFLVHRMVLPVCTSCKIHEKILTFPGYFSDDTPMKRVFIEAPLSAHKCDRCGNCRLNVTGDIARAMGQCGKCKQVAYCSKDCQTAAWSDHRKQCKAFVAGRATHVVEHLASSRPPFVPCLCMTDKYERHTTRLSYLGSNQCAWLGCSKPVGLTTVLIFERKCPLDTGVTHRTRVGFCSSRHRMKHLTQSCPEYDSKCIAGIYENEERNIGDVVHCD